MPLVLGLGSSHAPSMFAPAEKWPDIHLALTRGVPPWPGFTRPSHRQSGDFFCPRRGLCTRVV